MPVKFKDYPHFRPDLTPRQIFQHGCMDGMYWRDIYSNVTKKHYKDEYKKYPVLKGIPKCKLNNGKWDASINKYKVHASLSLEYWEKSNWIHPQDTFGALQWYCEFYQGRRTDDDKRQIGRFLRVLLRFGQKKDKTPRVKQALHHWAWNADKDHSKYIEQIKLNGWAKGASQVKI
jgi:hypothetical protein